MKGIKRISETYFLDLRQQTAKRKKWDPDRWKKKEKQQQEQRGKEAKKVIWWRVLSAESIEEIEVDKMDRAMLSEATSSEDSPTPGYMLAEIASKLHYIRLYCICEGFLTKRDWCVCI